MRNAIRFFTLLLIAISPLFAYADTPAPPRTYATTSPNNKFIFVMLAPISIQQDGLGEKGKERIRIREKYQESGMYLNDGSTKPLWTVDWYSHSVLVASDGVHVIRTGPWAVKASDEAFTFFANGKKIRSYKISELVSSIKDLPHSVSHFEWEARDSMRLDDVKSTLSVSTLNNEHYVFDYRSGKQLSKKLTDRVSKTPVFGTLKTLSYKYRFRDELNR